MELLQVMGMTTPKKMLDPNLKSSQQSEGSENSSNAGDEDNEEDGQEPESSQSDESDSNPAEEKQQNTLQMATAIHYAINQDTIPWMIIGIVAVILFLILLYFVLKKRWENQVEALSLENQVVNYYQFFLKKLSLAGYKKPVNHTLSEYAKNMEHELSRFASDEKNFSNLTEIYMATFYGRRSVSSEEAKLFQEFYKDFRKNLRKEMGVVRYFLKVVLHLNWRRKSR
jgi:cytochrome c-type biogenesis protein CcmH/NrfG